MATLSLNKVFVQSAYAVGGPQEFAGPIGHLLDQHYDDLYAEQKTFEQAERHMLTEAINGVIRKSGIPASKIGIAFGGDLLNQITASSYVMRNLPIPMIGVFGACSTSMLSLGLASTYVEAGFVSNALAFTSSHNATAERQFRYPVEYGVQKKETLTYTATGANAIIVGTQPTSIRVAHVTFGKVIDMKAKNPFDMGTAMAPAAYDTMKTHFKDLNRKPSDYDLIVTGDLSSIGKPIVIDLAARDHYDLSQVYDDCGLIIYDRTKQPVFAGGSGCATCGITTSTMILKRLRANELKRVLILATGALHSPTVMQQKETIPAVAHGVVLEVEQA